MRTIFAIFLLLFAFAAPAWAGTMRVVTLYAPPYAYKSAGQVVGIGAAVVREGLARMGYEAIFEIVPWKRALHMTSTGEADAIFNAVRTDERETFLYFSDEILILEQTTAFRKQGTGVTLLGGPDSVRQVRLGVGSGFVYGKAVDTAIREGRFGAVEDAPSVEKNIEKLLADRINVFLGDMLPALYSLKQLGLDQKVEAIPGANGQPIIISTTKSYLAFSQKTVSHEVAERFSAILREMKRDGTYDRIVEQY